MITIAPLDELGRDERGTTFVFDTDRRGPFLVAHRKAGSVSGKHYHRGRFPNKNPEELILMEGTVRVTWKDLPSGAVGSAEVTGPARLVVPAGLWHEVLALTDFVMLELNGPGDGQGDTFRLDGSSVY